MLLSQLPALTSHSYKPNIKGKVFPQQKEVTKDLTHNRNSSLINITVLYCNTYRATQTAGMTQSYSTSEKFQGYQNTESDYSDLTLWTHLEVHYTAIVPRGLAG